MAKVVLLLQFSCYYFFCCFKDACPQSHYRIGPPHLFAETDATVYLNRAAALMGLHRYAAAAEGVAAGGVSAGKAATRLTNALLQLGQVAAARELSSAFGDVDAATLSLVGEAAAAEASLPAPLQELLLGGSSDDSSLSPPELEKAWAPLFQLLRLAPHAEPYLCATCRLLLAQRKYGGAAAAARAILRQRQAGVEGALTRSIDVPLPSSSASSGDGGVLSVHPLKLPSVPVLLALALTGQGELAEAAAVLQRALAADPDGTGDAAGAAPLLKLVRHLTERKDAGNAAFKAGEHEAALTAYAEGAEASKAALPDGCAVFHSNAAAAYAAQGKSKEAASAFGAALRCWPGAAKSWARLAGLLGQQASTLDKAVRAQVAYAHLAPEDAAGGKTLLQLRAKGGEDEEALLHLDDEASLSAALRPRAGHGRRLVIVDVYADWCGPCKKIAPVFEKLALGHGVPLFVKVNSDKVSGSPTLAAAGVRALPTFLVYLDGKEINRMEGADPAGLEALVVAGETAWRRAPPLLPASSSASGAAAAAAAASAAPTASCPVLAEALAAADTRPDIAAFLKSTLAALKLVGIQ